MIKFSFSFSRNKYFFIFLFWTIWISIEFLLGNYSHVRVFDNGDITLPQLIAVKNQFIKYGYNYFAPYVASGVDAASQTLLPFSDLNTTLFTIFPGYFAYGIIMFIQRFIASYFTYRLCRDALKLTILPSLIAGLSYSLFNFSINSFTLYHGLGLPALPLILWVFEKMRFQKKSYFYSLILGIFVGFTSLFALFSPYALPFILFWLLLFKRLNQKTAVNYAIFSSAVIAVQAPNILALLTNVNSSHRISVDGSLTEENFFGFLLGWIFSQGKIFMIPLSIIVLTISLRKISLAQIRKPLLVLLFPIFAVIGLRLVIPVLPIKILRSFSYDRFEILIPFSLSIVLAYFTYLTFKKKNVISVVLLSAFFFTLLIASSVIIKIKTIKNYAPYRSLYSQPDLVKLSKIADNRHWRVATVTGGGIRPGYTIAYSLNSADGYLTYYPKSYQEFWAKVVSKRIAYDQMRHDDVNLWGNKIYLFGPKDYNNLSEIHFDNYYDLELLSRANVKYLIAMKPLKQENFELLQSDYRERMADWSEFSAFKKLTTFLFGKYYGPPLYIYENKKAYPRFYFEDNTPLQLVSYRPDLIVIKASNDEISKLVASVNYYPYWKAFVNGRGTEVERYMGVFLAVKVPKGENEVILKYVPNYFPKL